MKNYNYKLHIARKPIIVYKLVKPFNKNKCCSLFRPLFYFFNKEHTLLSDTHITFNRNPYKIEALNIINRGFRSFVTLKSLDQFLYVNYELLCKTSIAICIIPKGALYCTNNGGIASNKIIVKHIL